MLLLKKQSRKASTSQSRKRTFSQPISNIQQLNGGSRDIQSRTSNDAANKTINSTMAALEKYNPERAMTPQT
eukprot:scaffold9386_cov87-Skeletonema_menzelii.AAC.3